MPLQSGQKLCVEGGCHGEVLTVEHVEWTAAIKCLRRYGRGRGEGEGGGGGGREKW